MLWLRAFADLRHSSELGGQRHDPVVVASALPLRLVFVELSSCNLASTLLQDWRQLRVEFEEGERLHFDGRNTHVSPAYSPGRAECILLVERSVSGGGLAALEIREIVEIIKE